MAGPVVVGLDGTGNSVPAVLWGAEEAAARGLALHLLHSSGSPSANVPPADPEAAGRERRGAELLRGAVDLAYTGHPGIAVTTEQVAERPSDALLERSAEATMLILGSRGHGAIAGFLLGSVSLQVLGQAECPVVTVRQDAAFPQREIVVGVRHAGPEDEAVLEFAFTAADAHHTRVRAVRAWGPAATVAPVRAGPGRSPDGTAAGVAEQETFAEALLPWRARFPAVEVVPHVASGRAAPVLLAACCDAGLLVVGRRSRRSPMLLGPVVHAALHHANCPVSVVPQG
ncbi:universal stress protein [Streptomyces platensis]|uniref:Universal stress protein n=1 Tax=Streptomyces platensis TaxID=58346 RepID=A0AAE6NEL4_STRPT|nr:universal stress protein [Streptomyces platensis]OSY44407.1 Universal stress protein [Streptomyces platensis]QEV50756.1 universal stress protein [Streptomyces platensis]